MLQIRAFYQTPFLDVPKQLLQRGLLPQRNIHKPQYLALNDPLERGKSVPCSGFFGLCPAGPIHPYLHA